jgi:hypothetical protein
MKSKARICVRRTLLLTAIALLLDGAASAKSLNFNLSANTPGGGTLLFEYDDQLSDGDYLRFGAGSTPEFISILMTDGSLGPGAEINGWTLQAPNQFATYLPASFGGIDSYAFTLLNGRVTSMSIYSSSFYDFSYTGNSIFATSTLTIDGSHYTYDKSGIIEGLQLGVVEDGNINFSTSAVPEPPIGSLLLAGLSAAWMFKRRQPAEPTHFNKCWR